MQIIVKKTDFVVNYNIDGTYPKRDYSEYKAISTLGNQFIHFYILKHRLRKKP